MLVIPFVVLGVGLLMFACETARPGRRWLRAALLNSAQVAVVFLAGSAWDGWMVRHRPWSVDALGPTGGALLGYLAITFVYYWWHRWRHQSDFLWRWLHQLHHSPQRIEVLAAFYKHPFELLAN